MIINGARGVGYNPIVLTITLPTEKAESDFIHQCELALTGLAMGTRPCDPFLFSLIEQLREQTKLNK